MNKLAKFTVVLIIGFTFLNCNTKKGITNYQLQNNPPFKIVSASYEEWKGEQPTINGVKVFIKINTSKIELDSVYFRNMAEVLEFNPQTNEYVAHFTYPTVNNDLIISSDANQEFGNQVPKFPKKSNFQLNDNQAVISYVHKNEKLFYKISNLQNKAINTSTN